MKKLLLLLFISLATLVASAQLNSIPQNLSGVRSADISDQQLGQVVTQMRANNANTNQVYQVLLERGMSAVEANQLRTRLDNYMAQNPGTTTQTDQTQSGDPNNRQETGTNRNQSQNQNQNQNQSQNQNQNQNRPNTNDRNNNNITPVLNPKKIFGLEIFSNGVLNFEPDIRIATPANYIIGPDDEISISIYGYQEARYNLRVSPEGSINIPLVGVIYVSGLTIEQASAKIRSKLAANGYANIRTGLTKVDINISKIRSISVTVLGEVRRPGRYTVSSLSTAFNALYLSGGPNEIGSLRQIEIVRNGKVIERLDVYDFLVRGDQRANILLQDQDVIRIPPYKTRVSLEGEVKRTGLFEVIPGENLEKVLDFAGGFTDSAYTASIKAYKVTDTAKRIFDITKEQFKTYQPSRSESFVIRKIIDRFTNRVIIRGAVFLPGEYELTEGMTVTELIRKAQGLREDAYRERALIVRFSDNLTSEVHHFSPQAVLNGLQPNIPLRRSDEITITSVFDIKEFFNVTINGEVRNPGSYKYAPNLSLKDVVLLAGGFTEAASAQRIEIARRIRKDTFNINDVEIARVIEFSSAADLNALGADVKLQPWDVITVRRNPGYKTQVNVTVEGEVVYPGPYVIQARNERVSDLIKRAGGLTAQAYTRGAYLQRVNKSAVLKDTSLSSVRKVLREARDTSTTIFQDLTATTVKLGLNLDQILKTPGTDEDVFLQDGDILRVNKEVLEVKVNGEVMFPTQVVHKEGEDLRYYIDKAGGFTDDARKKRTYVLYPNGNAGKTKRFLFIKNYPRIDPGSEILVPKIPDRKKNNLSTGEIVAITSGAASLIGVLVALLNFIK